MSDWELFAPDDATMQQALSVLNMRKGDGLTPARVRFTVNYYGTKVLPTGATAVDQWGNAQPVTAVQPGVYANLRWIPPNIQLLAFPPTGVNLPAGVVATPLANANSHYGFYG